jgi:hypothetical protein
LILKTPCETVFDSLELHDDFGNSFNEFVLKHFPSRARSSRASDDLNHDATKPRLTRVAGHTINPARMTPVRLECVPVTRHKPTGQIRVEELKQPTICRLRPGRAISTNGTRVARVWRDFFLTDGAVLH